MEFDYKILFIATLIGCISVILVQFWLLVTIVHEIPETDEICNSARIGSKDGRLCCKKDNRDECSFIYKYKKSQSQPIADFNFTVIKNE